MRKILFTGTETTPMAGKGLAAFINAWNVGKAELLPVDLMVTELSADVREWIANHALDGNPDGTTVAELIGTPVVNPTTGHLNRPALEELATDGDLELAGGAKMYLADNFAKNGDEGGPDPIRVAINSTTNGTFRRVKANGRDHIVTGMVPLVGDSVMNSILYPDDEVHRSFEQLNNLPAPAGHPEIEGKRVSAFHPMAVNAFNIGGFVRKPTKRGRRVDAEFWLDEEVADKSDDGRETIRRIEAGEDVGVSTGLTLRLVQGNGTGPDGKAYAATGKDFQFDHVAILLKDTAAGAHVGTALVVNEEGEEILTATVDNVLASQLHLLLESAIARRVALIGDGKGHTWLREIDLDESFAIYSVSDDDGVGGGFRLFRQSFEQTETDVNLLGDPQEVTEITTYVPAVEREPETPNVGDKKMEITLEKATEFLAGLGFAVVNKDEAAETAAKLEAFEAARPDFEAWQATNKEELEALRAKVVEASDFTPEMVANMDAKTLDGILALATKATADNSLRGGGTGAAGGSGEANTVTAADCVGFINAPIKKEG